MSRSKRTIEIPIIPLPSPGSEPLAVPLAEHGAEHGAKRGAERGAEPPQIFTGELTESLIREWLHQVPDPEIPVISVVDLGVIRGVEVDNNNAVEIIVTPTYSGCPAMAVIAEDIKSALYAKGVNQLSIETRISPPWTTDWLSESGRARLEEYGIAPPRAAGGPARCPRCHSASVEKVSQFGSTPCKAQWRCTDCLEPFDYFKCI